MYGNPLSKLAKALSSKYPIIVHGDPILDTSDADAIEEDIALGKIAYAQGERLVGTLLPSDFSDADALALKAEIEAIGGTVTVAGSVPTVEELLAGLDTVPIMLQSLITETANFAIFTPLSVTATPSLTLT